MNKERVVLLSSGVDDARERLLNFALEDPILGRNVIYFDGWNGLGASAVLRSIAMVLPSKRTTKGLCFDRIMYIDCSEWKSRRAVQRTIVEELKLDSSVLAILDKKDEEDDFYGVDQGSRDVIQSVSAVIDSTLTSTRFMMIFLNGTDDEVDVTIFGIPQFTVFRKNKMIWTFKRRILTINNHTSEMASKLRYTHSVLSLSPRSTGFTNGKLEITKFRDAEIKAILHAEANTIVARNPCMLDIKPKLVAECCLYELFLHYNFHTITKSSWATHASNYWMCDGIIQGDMTREITNACQREINWKCDASVLDDFLQKFMRYSESPFLAIKDDDVYREGSYRWISVTSENKELHGLQNIPATASSFFLAFKTSDQLPNLPNGLFEHSSKLGVLILCCCAFNFTSPPFLKCHNLRFLGLDHCKDDKTTEGENHTSWLCLYNLWVLDLRYTEWNEIISKEKLNIMTNIRELNIEGVWGWRYTAELQGQLSNLQRLRLIKPTCQRDTSEDVDNSFIDKTSMEILDLSGNSDMKSLPTSLSKARSLQMLVLDGCDELESIGGLPPSLESLSFNGYGPASQWTQTVELPTTQFRPSSTTENKDVRISKISLAGCTQLENLFLCWLPNLVELDLSGTSIKILDFKTMVVQIPMLKRLFLIGCKHLRAINFLRESVPDLELMCIDTRAGIVCPPRPSIKKNNSIKLEVHAVFVDARLARSLMDLIRIYVHFNIHVTSSHTDDGFVQLEAAIKDRIGPGDQGSWQPIPAGQARYSDVIGKVGVAPMQAFPQPPATKFDRHVEIAQGSFWVDRELEKNDNNALGGLVYQYAQSLHVHDVSVRAILPAAYEWRLRWCRMERCPKLDTAIFLNSKNFYTLETFWASDLLMARCIWGGTGPGIFNNGFRKLRHLHLRSCPSLQVVLLGWSPSLPSLKTLHIIHCVDLNHIFIRQSPQRYHRREASFPKLTSIHLHDLPKLQNICNDKMKAPALKSIKIRGCWSLRRLPSVRARGPGEKKPTVEIEKDVWDALEWDAGHRPDHFEEPVHSRYYKEKLPRVSVLR